MSPTRELEHVDGALRAVLDGGAVGEEGREEGGLAVHHAVAVDERLAVVTERGRGDGAALGVDHARGVPHVEDFLHDARDFVAGEEEFARGPGVVGLAAVTAEHHVLDPVGEGPTGGGTRLDADAERRVAVGDHGLGEAEQLIERGGDLVAVGLEARRLVPDERLEVGLVGHAVLRAVDVAEAHGAGGPVLADRCGDIVGQRHDEAVASEVGELAGLREDRDVRRGAGFDLHVDLGLPVGGTDVEDGHVVGLSERRRVRPSGRRLRPASGPDR